MKGCTQTAQCVRIRNDDQPSEPLIRRCLAQLFGKIGGKAFLGDTVPIGLLPQAWTPLGVARAASWRRPGGSEASAC